MDIAVAASGDPADGAGDRWPASGPGLIGRSRSHRSPCHASAVDRDCDALEWSPIASAPVHSAFAGVLAGLVFAGIVLLLSARSDQVRRTNALVIFGSSFLVLAFDAFLFGVIAGERVCARAWTETMHAAGLLGLGALGIFAGICWLIDTSDTTAGRMTRFYVVTTYVIAIIVTYHVGATAVEYLDSVAAYSDTPAWLTSIARAYGWILLAGILSIAVTLAIRTRRGARHRVANRFVTATAYAYVACVVVALYAAGGAAGSAQDWTQVSATALVWNTLAALVLPAVTVLAQVSTLPSGRVRRNGAPPSTMSPGHRHTDG